jgi:tRNA(fMet)-specific endonuclease VapC
MAATYLLDTTIFSDVMREHAKVEARITTLSSTGRVFICSIVRGEVLYGLERMPKGRKRRALEAKAAGLFVVLPCEPVPEAAGDHYGRIKREAERKGTRLDENDLWIAATALALDAILVTRDSDFQRVSGLMVENWTL